MDITLGSEGLGDLADRGSGGDTFNSTKRGWTHSSDPRGLVARRVVG